MQVDGLSDFIVLMWFCPVFCGFRKSIESRDQWRSFTKSVAVLIVWTSLTACVARPLDYGTVPGTTNLSDVTINVPRETKLHAAFGENCKDFNAAPELLTRLGTQDKCAAIDKLLDGFRLTFKFEQCEAGITAESTNMIGLVSKIKPKDRVTKGCTYSVTLELGEIDAGKVYFSNASSSTRNLIVPKDAGPLITLKVELLPTPVGVSLGFPGSGVLPSLDTTSDLNIDVGFGKKQN